MKSSLLPDEKLHLSQAKFSHDNMGEKLLVYLFTKISIQFKEMAIQFQSDKSNYKLSVGSKKGKISHYFSKMQIGPTKCVTIFPSISLAKIACLSLHSITEGFQRFFSEFQQMAFLRSPAVPLFIIGTRLLVGRMPSVGFQNLIFVWRENNAL